MSRQFHFVTYTLATVCLAFIFHTLFGEFSLEVAYVYGLVGFLFVTAVTEPNYIAPKWRDRVRILAVIGTLIFVANLITVAIAVIQ